jgi:hypothetical protein
VALMVLGLAAVYPPLVVSASGLLSEPLFVALELGSVAAVLAFRESGRWRWIAAAGVLAGLAILTRTNGVVLLLPLALAAWRRPPVSLRAPAIALACAGYNRQATAAEFDLGPRWSDLVTYGAVPFALLAVAGCATTAARRTPRWVWAIPLLMLATCVLLSATQRFRLPADPFLVMLAALGLSAALAKR